MICKNCGKEIINGSRFCNYCGAAQHENSYQHTASSINGQAIHVQKRHLLTRKQAIFWGLYLIYSVGWILTLCNGDQTSDYEKIRDILLWVLPLLFVVAKRSMNSFTKK